MFPQSSQYYLKVLGMLFLVLGIYQDIINEYHHKFVQLHIKTEFMRYMKNAGPLVRPKDMTRYSYNPYLVEKNVFGISCGLIFI